MGYSGRPMVTIRNNKQLLKERKKVFDLDGISTHTNSDMQFNLEKFTDISDYARDQKLKNRKSLLHRLRKRKIAINIISAIVAVVIFALFSYLLIDIFYSFMEALRIL